MLRTLRAGAALATALLVAFGAAQGAAAEAPAQTEPASAVPIKLRPGEWAQARSDVNPDPDIRFGVLPNGMRYAIRKQSVPAGQTALRFWIGAGSLEETDDQAGLAHFLEHMAFDGSKAVKKGEMLKILERLGLAFGPDTNASTGFSQTIYKLDLPRSDDESLDTSLMLLRETASNLTLAPDAVQGERGVVLSEERLRDTPGYRILKARLKFLFPGQRLPTRLPIGQVDVIQTAPASRIADFYARYYRPDRAVLVAVGDFDPAAMEAKIRARFSDWTAQTPEAADPDPGLVQPRGEQARLVVEPGAPLVLQLSWVKPPDLEPDSLAKRRREMLEQLGLAVLNRRFSALTRSAAPPFIDAGASKGDNEHAAELTTVSVRADVSRWRQALAAADEETRRAQLYGVRQDELDREIAEWRVTLTTAAAGAATRRQADIADQIVGSLSEPEVVTSPAQQLARFENAVRGLTAAEVSAALKTVFSGSGPLLFVASPQPIEGGEQTLLAELASAQTLAVAPPAAPAQVSWPYQHFGRAGQVAERREVADLGTTFVRFANGVRLTVKPTKFRDDEVLARVNVGRGLLDLPKNRQSVRWASGALIEGGLKKIDSEDVDRVLAAKVFGAEFGVTDDAFVLTGETRTGDLATQLQVLAAYMADPGWRPEAFARVQQRGKTVHDQLEATDSGVLARDLPGLLHAGDRRWTFPSRNEIANARLHDFEAQIAPDLAKGSVEVVIVGDITVDQAIAATAATFGALPPRPEPKAAAPSAHEMAFPAATPQPISLTHKGRADQAIAFIAWPTTDYWSDPKAALDAAVLGEVLKLRLVDQLRMTEGATYSPSVSYGASLVWTGYGDLTASVEVPPARVEGFFADAAKIVQDLRDHPPGADELARAKQPRIEALQKAQVTNQFWLADLSGAQADPRRLDVIRRMVPGTVDVTAADVQHAAERFLKDNKAYKLVVRPQSATETRVASEEAKSLR